MNSFQHSFVGPNNSWTRPICPQRVQRPEPRRTTAQALQCRAPNSSVMQPRTTQSSADPKPHQKKKDKTGIGPSLKENLGISGKVALIAIQCAAPDTAVLCSLINHPQQFWDQTDGTNISLVKGDPTRGRRTANAGQYKRKSK